MRIIKGGVLLTTAAALLGSAACGSSGGNAAASSPTPAGSARGGFAAYAQCLREHGVNIPTTRASAGPGGGPGGGFGFRGLASANPQALQACRSLLPQQRGPGMQQMQAFRSCLSDHGVTLPTASPGAMRPSGAPGTPGVRRSPGAGMFGRLNTADPKVASALKTCRPLLPSFTPRPSPS